MEKLLPALMIFCFLGIGVFVGLRVLGVDISSIFKKPPAVKQERQLPRFDQTPNHAAIKEGWTKDDDYMILVVPEGRKVRPFYIDAFEAVISNHRAWSVPGQVPTDRLRFDDAFVACNAAGKRLCYADEWQTACRGGTTSPISFSKAKAMIRNCNVAQKAKQDGQYLSKTDSNMTCISKGLPLFNMIGNVAEFVQDREGNSMIVGLTYHDGQKPQANKLLTRACEQVVASSGEYPAELYSRGVGFRCCTNTN